MNNNIEKQQYGYKFTASVMILIAAVILLMMNLYGMKSMGFDLSQEKTINENAYTYTPHITLPKGKYKINISGTGNVKIQSGEGNLIGEGNAGEEFTIKLHKDESDLVLISGGSVSHAEIKKQGAVYSDLYFITLFAALAMIYIIYIRFRKRKSSEDDAVAVIIAAAAVFASYPLFNDFIGFGHDLNFHLYRMEGIKDGLISGQFPVRLHPTHNNGYGYITSSVYPELFMYFPAILRILGASPVFAYNTFLFGVNVITAFVMYYSVKGISKSKYAGMTASVIYTLSTWRVINLYYRAAVGEALAMVFFPLLIYGIYLILKGDKKKWWILTAACTGIFQSHVISTVFAAITIFVFILVFVKDFISDKRWVGFIKAGLATVLVNLWYLAAFITYYIGQDLAIKHIPENTLFYLETVIPTELFNVFNTQFGYSQLLSVGIRGEMSLSLGVGVSICLIIGAAYFIFRKKKTIENEGFVFLMFAFGILLMFMSTNLFPWKLLQQNKLINAFCGTVRMPWRFLSLASPLFCMAAALIINTKISEYTAKKAIIGITCFICAVCFVSWGTAYTTQNDAAVKKGCAVPTAGSVGLDEEYYLYGTQKELLEANRYVLGGGVNIDRYEKKGTNMNLKLSGASDGSWVEVPLLYYPGYSAKDSNGNKLKTEKGNNNVLRVNLEDGSDEVRIKYSGLWYFKIADLISLATILSPAAIWLYRRRKKDEKIK